MNIKRDSEKRVVTPLSVSIYAQVRKQLRAYAAAREIDSPAETSGFIRARVERFRARWRPVVAHRAFKLFLIKIIIRIFVARGLSNFYILALTRNIFLSPSPQFN